MKNYLSILFVLAIVIVGCQKDDIVNPNPHNYFAQDESKSLANPANSSNQFDTLGATHNTEVIDFVDNYLLRAKNLTQDSVLDWLGTKSYLEYFLKTYYGAFDDDPSAYPTDLRTVYNNETPSFNYYFQVRTIMTLGSLTLQQRIDSISSFENSFNFSPFSADEKAVLLKGSSIARYSMFMWAPSSSGGLGYADRIYAAKAFDWNKFARADIWGAVGGALFTANPLGALGGGVASSAFWALDEYAG